MGLAAMVQEMEALLEEHVTLHWKKWYRTFVEQRRIV